VSRKKASIEAAVSVATDLYDQAPYRQRLGLEHKAHSFAQIANATLHELRLLRDAGLLKDSAGQTRTLTAYATLELLTNTTDIHRLSKQLGNSAAMVERYYSKLAATMIAKNYLLQQSRQQRSHQ